MIIKNLLIVLAVCLFAIVSFAQPNPAETAQKLQEMKKLDGMIGRWEGSGWMISGAAKESFVGTETVQKKLDGLILLVEGNFKTPLVAGQEQKVVHQTLAVLSSNLKTRNYDFKTYLLNGSVGSQELNIVGDKWEWGFQFPGIFMKYTITIKDNVWSEIGEYSADGTKWKQIFQMSLKKVV